MNAAPHNPALLPPLPARPAREERLGRRLAWSWGGAAALHLVLFMGYVAFGAALPGTFGQRHGSGLTMPLVRLVSAKDAAPQGQHALAAPAATETAGPPAGERASGPAASGASAPAQAALPAVPQEQPAPPSPPAVVKAVPVAAPAEESRRQNASERQAVSMTQRPDPAPAAPARKKAHQQAAPANPASTAPSSIVAPDSEAVTNSASGSATHTASAGSGGARSESSGASAAGGNTPGAAPDQPVPFGQPTGPAYKSRIQVEYPAQALRQQLTGKVLLRVRITASGQVESVEVISSSHEVFVRAAERAVRAATFHPFTQGGKAQPCWTVLPVEFRITG